MMDGVIACMCMMEYTLDHFLYAKKKNFKLFESIPSFR
jgi:hypothetical protein